MVKTVHLVSSVVILAGSILIVGVPNAVVSYNAHQTYVESVRENRKERQDDKEFIRTTLTDIANESKITSEKVTKAMIGLTDVFSENQKNDDRNLHLLEAILTKLNKDNLNEQSK